MSSPIFAVDASSGGKVKVLATSNKLHVRASELEAKLETLNTTCSNINVSVGDVDVNTDGLESLQTAGNATLALIMVNYLLVILVLSLSVLLHWLLSPLLPVYKQMVILVLLLLMVKLHIAIQ